MLSVIFEKQSIDQKIMATKDRTLVAIILCIKDLPKYPYQS